jgi:NAD(P)-dependent dehydrogenase (short-subunit alcohol dehydrogenase family)|tara:strand:+ start:28364 stop:29110 length:747 start_codon:yes stop_codon:yes gene_type:complete
MTNLSSFSSKLNVVVIGSNGGLGKAFLEAFEADSRINSIYAFSRNTTISKNHKTQYSYIDLENEDSIKAAAKTSSSVSKIDLVIVATGILHNEKNIKPEKSMAQIDPDAMRAVIGINTIGPIMIAKHFLPKLRRDSKTVFAALSARVGSINDNRMGGWASYRASKAALNMLIKTVAIEQKRLLPESIVVSLHPGTVDTQLSQPFQKNVGKSSLFKASDAANNLIKVVNNLTIDDTGSFLAWDGSSIEY